MFFVLYLELYNLMNRLIFEACVDLTRNLVVSISGNIPFYRYPHPLTRLLGISRLAAYARLPFEGQLQFEVIAVYNFMGSYVKHMV